MIVRKPTTGIGLLRFWFRYEHGTHHRGMKKTKPMALVVMLLAMAMVCGAAMDAGAQEGGQDDQVAFNTLMIRYEAQKKDAVVPFIMNLLLPFGIGSFVQGDHVGGAVVAGGRIAGGAMTLVDLLDGDGRLGALFWVGTGVSVGVTIAGWIIPWTYANAFNDQLRRDLGISIDSTGVSVRLASW